MISVSIGARGEGSAVQVVHHVLQLLLLVRQQQGVDALAEHLVSEAVLPENENEILFKRILCYLKGI